MNKVIRTIRTDYIHLYKVVDFYTDSSLKTTYYFKDGLKCRDLNFIKKHIILNKFISEEDIQKARNNSICKKETKYDKLVDALKENWMSNYQIQQFLKSSSGDRIMRMIRKNPPIGYLMDSRKKNMPTKYRKCLEYRLVKI